VDSRPKQKRPSGGSPQKAWFTMNAGPLGRLTPFAAIEHAVRRHDDALEAGQMT
jgi:hypothetical protein